VAVFLDHNVEVNWYTGIKTHKNIIHVIHGKTENKNSRVSVWPINSMHIIKLQSAETNDQEVVYHGCILWK